MFATTVKMMLSKIMLATGTKQEKFSDSILMSPGRLPKLLKIAKRPSKTNNAPKQANVIPI
jgi:hypothetical protein